MGKKCAYHYQIENDGERYDLESNGSSDWETGRDWLAEEAAEDFYNKHDGWEATWPLELSLYNGEEFIGTYRIVMEPQPHFYAYHVTA